MVDVSWESGIKPLLLQRFPSTSPEDLQRARSFAYGGCVIQDLGYYPFGNHFFSNLLHYVRSGDFIEVMLRDAQEVDEYAFALGSLAHYVTDSIGHPVAVNRAVPEKYPKLRRKFGDSIPYAGAPRHHISVEFSFDIVQVASGAYLPETYRSFIGFSVATPLLERAFRETYGLEMKQIFSDEDRTIGTYRYAVSQLLPTITEAAWRDKRDEILKALQSAESSRIVFEYRRADYEQAYGLNYQRPGLFAQFLGFLYRILPKIGPLRGLAFEAPTAEMERQFVESFQESRARYAEALIADREGRLHLRNIDLDTGNLAEAREYSLADQTYAELLQRLSKHPAADIPIPLSRNIRAFYTSQPRPPSRKKESKRLERIERELVALPQ
jgi:hypothetical protein